MKAIHQRLTVLAQQLAEKGLAQQSKDVEDITLLTRNDDEEEDENERPLLDAKKTGLPGTWVTDDEGIIKTSRD